MQTRLGALPSCLLKATLRRLSPPSSIAPYTSRTSFLTSSAESEISDTRGFLPVSIFRNLGQSCTKSNCQDARCLHSQWQGGKWRLSWMRRTTVAGYNSYSKVQRRLHFSLDTSAFHITPAFTIVLKLPPISHHGAHMCHFPRTHRCMEHCWGLSFMEREEGDTVEQLPAKPDRVGTRVW